MQVDLVAEASSLFCCRGDLKWKPVAVVLAKMPIWTSNQGMRILIGMSIKLASIQEKVQSWQMVFWPEPSLDIPGSEGRRVAGGSWSEGGGGEWEQMAEVIEQSPAGGGVVVEGAGHGQSWETGRREGSPWVSHCWVGAAACNPVVFLQLWLLLMVGHAKAIPDSLEVLTPILTPAAHPLQPA